MQRRRGHLLWLRGIVFIPDKRLPNNDAVIYFGTVGNDHSPGASSYTHAEIFDMDTPDDAAEYLKRVGNGSGSRSA